MAISVGITFNILQYIDPRFMSENLVIEKVMNDRNISVARIKNYSVINTCC